MAYDGTVKIGTELDDSGLKKALKALTERQNRDFRSLVKSEKMPCLFLLEIC